MDRSEYNEIIYPSLAMFISLNYDYLHLGRFLPEYFAQSTHFIFSDDKNFSMQMPLRFGSSSKTMKEDLYSLVKYTYNKESEKEKISSQ